MSSVYLLKNEDQGVYKIGRSIRPQSRAEQLRTGNHSELTVIETYSSPYANEIETALHKTFSSKLIQGEWFRLTANQVQDFDIRCQQIENNIKTLIENGNPFVKKRT